MRSTDFWDKIFSKGQDGSYSHIKFPDIDDPIFNRALEHFGSVDNRIVLDLGCGRGASSLFFAYHGANVISIDSSNVAISNLSNYCKENQFYNIKTINMSAHEISTLGKIDFVFGSMILHHIEPFNEFAKILRQSIKEESIKGFFWENNAQSNILILFRKYFVGKLWVPKYGESDEFPLTPGEVNEMRKHFNITVEYPELFFFRLISSYLLRGHFKNFFLALDNYFYRFKSIRKYSYRQYILIS